jgi:pimeloyl-ACP methyl ester carboxylesterase
MIKKILRTLIGLLIFVSVTICIFYLVDKNNRLNRLEADSKLAETAAGTIEYKITGDKGPVVLVMHGTPGGYDFPFPIDGYRVLVPSRPGYLRTPLQVGKTPIEQARAFSALLDSLGIERVIVLGGSGGGPAAISFAALFPEKTIALGLAMAASQKENPMEYEEPFFMKSDFFMWGLFSLMQNDKVLKSMLTGLIPDQTSIKLIFEDPQKVEMIKSKLWNYWPPSRRAAGQLNDEKQFTSFDPPVSDIKVPTLIIHGSKDIAVPVEQSKRTAELIPGSQLEIIEGAGHFAYFSHYDEFMKITYQFLRKITADSQYTEHKE